MKEPQRAWVIFEKFDRFSFLLNSLDLTPASGLHGSPDPPLCDITVYLYLVTLLCSPSHAPIDTLCTTSLSHAVHTLFMLCAEVISEMNHCFFFFFFLSTGILTAQRLFFSAGSMIVSTRQTTKAQMTQII